MWHNAWLGIASVLAARALRRLGGAPEAAPEAGERDAGGSEDEVETLTLTLTLTRTRTQNLTLT